MSILLHVRYADVMPNIHQNVVKTVHDYFVLHVLIIGKLYVNERIKYPTVPVVIVYDFVWKMSKVVVQRNYFIMTRRLHVNMIHVHGLVHMVHIINTTKIATCV